MATTTRVCSIIATPRLLQLQLLATNTIKNTTSVQVNVATCGYYHKNYQHQNWWQHHRNLCGWSMSSTHTTIVVPQLRLTINVSHHNTAITTLLTSNKQAHHHTTTTQTIPATFPATTVVTFTIQSAQHQQTIVNVQIHYYYVPLWDYSFTEPIKIYYQRLVTQVWNFVLLSYRVII